MEPIIDHAHAQEERSRNQPVSQHDNEATFDALAVEGEQADCDEAHVRDRRIGNQLLHVLLHKRDKRRVDDCDH